jgi:hypothetical protein
MRGGACGAVTGLTMHISEPTDGAPCQKLATGNESVLAREGERINAEPGNARAGIEAAVAQDTEGRVDVCAVHEPPGTELVGGGLVDAAPHLRALHYV